MYVRKLSDDERPLRLRLSSGPNEKVLSFVLKENETGDVNVSIKLTQDHKNITLHCFLRPFFTLHTLIQLFSPPSLQWHAFSMPELKNFLRILQREEEEHIKQIVQRYALARTKMQGALAGSTPGWDYSDSGGQRAPLGWIIKTGHHCMQRSQRVQKKTPLRIREREIGRKTMREKELARMCVWNDARDEKCLTPGESDVPARMSWEEGRLANETVLAPSRVYMMGNVIILYLSYVTLA